ncbi:L,D-transpeptidase [Wenxinia marina]|uniref:L,D-transpeptidase n=1 Tax=Wenxinia marina TaxID=390641 RepID=UPI00036B4CE3|nr:L,D-transpeptidase [Wenxinia marina]GGL59229.1 L,D-transpeptidase [Wenxinia marina]
MTTRRLFLAALPAALVSACARPPAPPIVMRTAEPPPAPPPIPPLPARYGAITDEPYPVPAVPEGVVPPRFWRQEVDNPYPDMAEGDLTVDPDDGYLHLALPGGRALRYGVGTGAAAYDWSGTARLQFRRRWPRWKAPDSMIERRPEFAPYSVANGGMDPGPGNPLGARALYLFQNGEDTLYRIHGACEPQYVGKAVSSGCVRMLDQDVIDLHDRVRDGVTVTVLPSVRPARLETVW